MGSKKAIDILNQVNDILETARCGLQMVTSDNPDLRLVGLRNLIVFGRAVTNVLQQLRSIDQRFEQWYRPWVHRMREDPIASYFYKLRSEILKEGRLQTGGSVGAALLDVQALLAAVPKSPGAQSFFIGDRAGGSGWEIKLANGETETFYVQIPKGIPGVNIDVNFHLSGAPGPLRDVPIPALAQEYFSTLVSLVEEAKREFGDSK